MTLVFSVKTRYDAKGNYIAIQHNTAGKTEVVTDRSGNATIYTYDINGNAISIIYADGNEVTYAYDDPANPDKHTAVTDQLGNVTQYAYDANGRVISITDPAGNVAENDYDDFSNVIETRQYYTPDLNEPNDIVLVSRIHNTYEDSLLTETKMYDPNNEVVRWSRQDYNDNTRLLEEVHQIDPCGIEPDIVTTYVYYQQLSNSADQPYSVISDNKTTYFLYNDKGEQFESREHFVDANNPANNCKIYTETVYDDAGRAIETIREVNDVNGNVTAYTLTLNSTIYNSIGRVRISINELDLVTEYDYDESGNVTETRTYNTNDELLTISRTLYDIEDRVWVSVGSYEPNDTNLPIGTENVYDVLGRVKETRKWADVEIILNTETAENAEIIAKATGWTHGNLLSYTRTEYDPAGRVNRVYTQDSAGQEYCTTEYVYDSAGKQIQVIDLPDDELKRAVTTTHYKGNLHDYVTDNAGRTTYFDYDTLGRLIKTTYPATAQNPVTYVHIKYDGFGRKVFESELTAEPNPNNAKGKIYDYNDTGNMKSVTAPQVENPENGNQLTNPVYNYDYDIQSNLTRITDAKNRQTTFTYNELNNQTSRRLPLGQTEYKEYDNLGRLTKVIDFNNQVAGYFYDSLGRLQYEKYYDNNDSYPDEPTNVIEYNYDNLGRRISAVIDGNTWAYHYDIEGRVILLTSPQGEIGYEYNSITGLLKYVRTPANGSDTEIEYVYDLMRRLSQVIVHRRNGVAVNEIFSYGYNTVGSLEWLCHPNGDCTTYSYDELNRLIELKNEDSSSNILSKFVYQLADNGRRESVTETFAGQDMTITWGYDNLNRLLSETYDAPDTSNDYVQTYVYDLVGNRLSNTLNGTATYYHYNSNDHLLKETSDFAGNNILVQYQYNNNGSMTQKSQGTNITNYVYNLQNRLISVNDGTTVANYGYNPDGKRVKKQIVGGATTNYLIDSHNHTGYQQVLKETTGSTNISYVIGLEILSQNIGTNSPQYLLKDGHSSVRQIANSSGTVTSNYHFDAYGNLLSHSGIPDTNILYVGQMRDSHIGLYDNWHRWYDPQTGRMLTSDIYPGSSQDPISLHRYLYCHANPINAIDPSGYFSISEISVVQFVQKIWRSKWVQYSWKGYTAATTTMDAIQLVSQITMAGTFNPLIAASVGADLLPFSKIIKAVKGLRNLGKGVRSVETAAEGLTGAYRNMGRGQNAVEALGELGAEAVAHGHGLEKVADFERAADGHGFDFIFKNPKTGSYIVVEAKGGTSKLSTLAGGEQQMSKNWIEASIERVKIDNPNLAGKLEKQFKNKTLEAMVVSVPINKVTDSVETVKYAYVGLDEIGNDVFGIPGF